MYVGPELEVVVVVVVVVEVIMERTGARRGGGVEEANGLELPRPIEVLRGRV